jgi:hypothetical protein
LLLLTGLVVLAPAQARLAPARPQQTTQSTPYTPSPSRSPVAAPQPDSRTQIGEPSLEQTPTTGRYPLAIVSEQHPKVSLCVFVITKSRVAVAHAASAHELKAISLVDPRYRFWRELGLISFHMVKLEAREYLLQLVLTHLRVRKSEVA